MTVESELKRIADALEALASNQGVVPEAPGAEDTPAPTKKKAAKKKAASKKVNTTKVGKDPEPDPERNVNRTENSDQKITLKEQLFHRLMISANQFQQRVALNFHASGGALVLRRFLEFIEVTHRSVCPFILSANCFLARVNRTPTHPSETPNTSAIS